MKKRLFGLVLSMSLIGAAASLSGCSKQEAAETTAAESEAAEEAESESAAEVESKEAEGGDAAKADDGTVKPVAVRIEQVNDDISEDKGDNIRKTAAVYEYPRLYLDGDDAKGYPELAKAFEDYNAKADSQKDETLKTLKDEYDEVKDFYGEDSDMYVYENYNGSILRADSNVVSMLIGYEDFHGGAHGYYFSYGVNFDTKTGKQLLLSDVVKDKDAFVKLVSERFAEEYGSRKGEYGDLKDAGEQLKEQDFSSDEGNQWSISPDCVTVYFSPYTLGAYAQGAQEISIYFDEAPEVFNEQYTVSSEDYAVPINAWHNVKIDVGNGKREPVTVEQATTEYTEEAGLYKTQFNLGETSLLADWESYSIISSYLVRSNGKYYIYAFQGSDNDYVFLSVVDVAAKKVDDSLNSYYNLLSYYSNSDSYVDNELYESIHGGAAFTNPKKFELTTRLDILGTYTAYKTYEVGQNGLPVSSDEYYISESSFAMKAVKDLELEKIDTDGNVTGKETVPAGSFLAVARTDGKGIADLVLVDEAYIETTGESEWEHYLLTKDIAELAGSAKTMYRVTVERTEYPYKVNGEEEDSVFAGVMYAG